MIILSHTFFYLFPSILEFWCLVTVTFKFTALYNNFYRKKNSHFLLIKSPWTHGMGFNESFLLCFYFFGS